jgi:hypothetical protein
MGDSPVARGSHLHATLMPIELSGAQAEEKGLVPSLRASRPFRGAGKYGTAQHTYVSLCVYVGSLAYNGIPIAIRM